MFRLILLFLLMGCIAPCHAQYFDTLHIHYDIGEAGLQKKDKAMLDSIAQQSGNRRMLIYSYADYLGSERPNQHLSDNRALEVKDYLLKKGVTPEQIMECTGLGKVAGSGGAEGDVTYRRTDIFIRKEAEKIVEQKKTVAVTNTKMPFKEKIKTKIPSGTVTPEKAGSKAIPDWDEDHIPPGKVTKIDVESLKVDQTLNLENILFYPGRADIINSSYAELDNLYNTLYDNPALKIKLEGHVCCCVYPDGYFEDTPTWGLSVARAFRIYKHLIDRGIAPERMQYQGFGRTRPIRENEKTVEEGQVNRRVEIRVLAK